MIEILAQSVGQPPKSQVNYDPFHIYKATIDALYWLKHHILIVFFRIDCQSLFEKFSLFSLAFCIDDVQVVRKKLRRFIFVGMYLHAILVMTSEFSTKHNSHPGAQPHFQSKSQLLARVTQASIIKHKYMNNRMNCGIDSYYCMA